MTADDPMASALSTPRTGGTKNLSPSKRGSGNNKRNNNGRRNKRPKKNGQQQSSNNNGPAPMDVAPVAAETKTNRGPRKSAPKNSKPKDPPPAAAASAATNAHGPLASLVTDQKFADVPHINAASRKALANVFQYEYMTPVQAQTLPLILEGNKDCLAKAKTGTGKTLGFLIPTVEHLLRCQTTLSKQDVGSLIISPARELAFQIAKEAQDLLTFHSDIKVISCVGGTNMSKDLKALKGSVQMVVATPGRLLDHLTNHGLADRMQKLDVLILDEADQLLDMGFRPDIERILQCLQSSAATRQTLLFSATVPKSVQEIASLALRPNYDFVDTVGDDADQTHLHVKQELMVAEQADQIAAIASILERKMPPGKEPFKMMVFFTTARLTGFMADFFRASKPGYEVLDIHSRKSQAQRKKASDRFRAAKQAVLFSSDVSARGMDYPDVTFVLQAGLTERDQYIHRLGRTARAGKEGKGALLLAPYEERWMRRELKDMPLEVVPVPEASPATHAMLDRGFTAVYEDKDLQLAAQQAYGAWLGYYKGHLKKCNWKPETLVQAANQWAKDVGLAEQPRLQKKTVGKMGLKGVPGLLLGDSFGGGPRNNNGGANSGRGGGPRNSNGGAGRGGGRR